MSKPVLHYFPGRGVTDIARYLLAVVASNDYEERFLTEKEHMDALRADPSMLMWEQVPFLEIDGLRLVQSGAIARYLARKGDLYGSSNADASSIDMIYEGVKDFWSLLVGYPFQSDDAKAKGLETIQSKLPRYFGSLERQYGADKTYLVGGRLSLADVKVLETVEIVNELLPGVTAAEYPNVTRAHAALRALPVFATFFTSDKRKPTPDAEYVATVRKVLAW